MGVSPLTNNTKNGCFEPQKFWRGPIFMGVSPLTNNTAKMSVGETLVKIRPADAQQLRRKIKKTNQNKNMS